MLFLESMAMQQSLLILSVKSSSMNHLKMESLQKLEYPNQLRQGEVHLLGN